MNALYVLLGDCGNLFEDRDLRVIELTSPPSPVRLDLSLESHSDQHGTRLDAPWLIVGGGRAVDQLVAECFVREAVLLDLTNTKPCEAIDDEDLEGAEEEVGLSVREGEAVIVHTGWKRSEGECLNHPVLSRNAGEYLRVKRVSIVATDTQNLDSPVDRAFQVHDILLRKGILVVEDFNKFGGVGSVEV